MVLEGRIAAYGVSVERVEEGLKAIEYHGVASVQIIFNAFRRRPAELFFGEAARREVGIIARVPLASGLLSGRYTRETTFGADDHRNFNRSGEAFDLGETFAGVPFDVGLDAVEELRPLVPEGATMAQFALRGILMHPVVSTVIPGARNLSRRGPMRRRPCHRFRTPRWRRSRRSTSTSRRTCTTGGRRHLARRAICVSFADWLLRLSRAPWRSRPPSRAARCRGGRRAHDQLRLQARLLRPPPGAPVTVHPLEQA
jgi:hypothetical protein